MPLSITAMLRRGLNLREEPFGRLHEIDCAMRDRLHTFAPLVALHRAGNVLERIEAAARTGALAETDVREHRGMLVVSHEHRLGPLSFDRSRLLLRLGDPPLPLPAVLEAAQRVNARLLLDLKLDATWTPALTGALRQYGLLESGEFTGEWGAVDAIANARVEFSRLYYGGLNHQWKLRRFLDQQTARRRPGVSLHRRLASRDNIARLHESGASVFVYVLSRPEDALDVLERGADGLITNNVALAEVWANRN